MQYSLLYCRIDLTSPAARPAMITFTSFSFRSTPKDLDIADASGSTFDKER